MRGSVSAPYSGANAPGPDASFNPSADTGILNAAGCCTLGKERGEAEKQLYGVTS